jgi:NADPH2:quinone reductase
MRNLRIMGTRFGGPEVLQLVEEEVPEPAPGWVRVRIRAAGVAFGDIAARRGDYARQTLPFAPGYDIAGEVDRLGAGVIGLEPGQLVAALPGAGGYAEYICLPAAELVPVPGGVDPAEAVSMVLNYVTAYQLLYRVAYVEGGERVLIHGAAGGVGSALLQLGRLAEAQLYGAASQAKHGLVARLGGTPIDYRCENVWAHLRNLTGGGLDVVFDSLGGAALEQSYGILRAGGRLVSFGCSAARGADMVRASFETLERLRRNNGRRSVLSYGAMATKRRHPEWFGEDLRVLLHLLAQRYIQPVIAMRMPLAHAARAHRLLESGTVMGKIMLLC